jgi:hypothetical protein
LFLHNLETRFAESICGLRVAMGDDLLNLWGNLSLSEVEDGEVEIQATEVKKIVQRGQHCTYGEISGGKNGE